MPQGRPLYSSEWQPPPECQHERGVHHSCPFPELQGASQPPSLRASSLEADSAVGRTAGAGPQSCRPASTSAPGAEHRNGLLQNWAAACRASLSGRVLEQPRGFPFFWLWSSPLCFLVVPPCRRPSASLRSVPSGVTVPPQASRPREHRDPRHGEEAGSRLLPPPIASVSPAPMPTIFESQELEDTVDNGDDDGERQKVRAGLQQGHLGRGAWEPAGPAVGPPSQESCSLHVPWNTK